MTRTFVSMLLAATIVGSVPPAFAQTTIGSQTVSEADRAAVQARCDELFADGRAVAPTGDAAPSGETAATGTAAAELPAGTAAANESVATQAGAGVETPAAKAGADATAAVNLDSITLEECRDAKLVD